MNRSNILKAANGLQSCVLPADIASVLEKRLYPRFECEREVEVAYFRAGRRCAVQKAVACDISERGVRLQVPQPAPVCDKILVRNGNMVIPYVIRSRYEKDGLFYVGAETITA